MNDFISREAAIKVLCDACGNAACPKGLIPRCSYYEKMQSIPAVDVQPAKRGKWILIDNDTVHGKCSECGFECHYYEDDVFGMPFCPNCNAQMMEEE